MFFLRKENSKNKNILDKGMVSFNDPKVQKSFEKFYEAAKKAPLEDQMRLIKKVMRD